MYKCMYMYMYEPHSQASPPAQYPEEHSTRETLRLN